MEAKGGAGSATLSMAYAGFRYSISKATAFIPLSILTLFLSSFAEKVIKASKGEKGIVEPTYVYLPGVSGGDTIAKETGLEYFSVPVELGVCKQNDHALEDFSLIFV